MKLETGGQIRRFFGMIGAFNGKACPFEGAINDWKILDFLWVKPGMARHNSADPLFIGDKLGTSWNRLSTCACLGHYKITKCWFFCGGVWTWLSKVGQIHCVLGTNLVHLGTACPLVHAWDNIKKQNAGFTVGESGHG